MGVKTFLGKVVRDGDGCCGSMKMCSFSNLCEHSPSYIFDANTSSMGSIVDTNTSSSDNMLVYDVGEPLFLRVGKAPFFRKTLLLVFHKSSGSKWYEQTKFFFPHKSFRIHIQRSSPFVYHIFWKQQY